MGLFTRLKQIVSGAPAAPTPIPAGMRAEHCVAPGSRCAGRIVYREGCSFSLDAESEFGGTLTFDRDNAVVRIGKRSFVGGSTLVCAESITIGDDVMISWGATIADHDSHSPVWVERQNDVREWLAGRKDWTKVKIRPVVISDKVWIGFNAIILRGVTIGEGAVVGAGSVVTKDVAPYTLVAGNPARVIRRLA